MANRTAQEEAWDRRRYSVPPSFLRVEDVRVAATKTTKFLKGGVVTLVADSTCYPIYRDLLAQRSAYMRNVLATKYEGPVPVEVEGTHLETYLHLLLRDELIVLHLPSNDSFDMLLGVYSVASKLDDRKSKRITMHTMVSLAREKGHGQDRPLPSAEAISLVYSTTSENDPIRLFLLDLIVDRDDIKWMEINSEGLPSTFSAKLHVAVMKFQKQYAVPLADSFDRCDIRKYLEEDIQDVPAGAETGEAKAAKAQADEAETSGLISRCTSVARSVADPSEEIAVESILS
ncbi:uncharacterized protein N0V89_005842 [Didymosphaeria variabile]|uniref:BTB domain-containing protein n=1 Tax=Didymosphaeria variabile TaxID=1932322 RepID=A0A9W8XM69_9PLEO|nr:uncharacterized protein N0V89_005842 [Didymosphaeria variabile]KAJ4354109.1 hypothetical protein N0V89_005842 [Didymosphaeria variabile]